MVWWNITWNETKITPSWAVLLTHNTVTNVDQIYRWSAVSFILVTRIEATLSPVRSSDSCSGWLVWKLEPVTTCWCRNIIKWRHYSTSVLDPRSGKVKVRKPWGENVTLTLHEWHHYLASLIDAFPISSLERSLTSYMQPFTFSSQCFHILTFPGWEPSSLSLKTVNHLTCAVFNHKNSVV